MKSYEYLKTKHFLKKVHYNLFISLDVVSGYYKYMRDSYLRVISMY